MKETLKKLFADEKLVELLFYGEIHYFEEYQKKLLDEGINYKLVANYGGEDCGVDYWKVYLFYRETEKVYIKFDGWYYSYDGATYDKWWFAEPKEKIVTVYE